MTRAGAGKALSEREAWAAWNRLAEPQDPVAAAIVAHLGAVEGLEWVSRHLISPRVNGTVGRSLAAALERWRPRFVTLDPTADLEQAAQWGARFIIPSDPQWPVGFERLGPARPFGVWATGTADLADLLTRSIAVVGARAATAYGIYAAQSLAFDAASLGWTVVSGGAWGIDAQAHRSALDAQGRSAAFLACGIDRRYPLGNAALLDEVATSGALISEVPPGEPAYKARFLHRNRLIAAAVGAVVVVEAAQRSGALSTATRASELGVPVGAVPGPITSAVSSGCHRLLRSGAGVCVTSGAEAVELAGPLAPETPPSAAGEGSAVTAAQVDDDRLRSRVLDAVARAAPTSVWQVASRAGTSANRAAELLAGHEAAGHVMRSPLGWVRLV